MIPVAPDEERDDKRPRFTTFRKRRYGPLPTAEQMKRQSDVVQSAWRHFGEAGPAIAFLNTRNDLLEGEPLRLAIESDDGLARVHRLLEKMTLEA